MDPSLGLGNGLNYELSTMSACSYFRGLKIQKPNNFTGKFEKYSETCRLEIKWDSTDVLKYFVN